MRTITFYTHHVYANKTILTTYASTLNAIKNFVDDVHTTQVALISFDLLVHFDKIFLNVNGEIFELGLGSTNTWTDKELRVAHNLLKIVTAQFLVHL
jgi:hypothetical protein